MDASGERRTKWSGRDLATLLSESTVRFADRVAVVTTDCTLTYKELGTQAFLIAAAVDRAASAIETPQERRCAVMGTRTTQSFVGVCAALFAGASYVPLNPKFPVARTQAMLTRADPCALHVEAGALEPLIDTLAAHARSLTIIVPDLDDTVQVAARLPAHRIYGRTELGQLQPLTEIPIGDRSIAYVMFTSGSTGEPKGVIVSQNNVVACLAAFGDRYEITEHDRFSQNFELTFDLSVFDMFLCWLHGASLHVPPIGQQKAPFRFVNEAALTVWFSVPSLARMMHGLRMLKPDSLPSLRWSLFCGEALTTDIAAAWAHAASRSVVENLYGPTEATIACTVHRFDPLEPIDPAWNGIIPIGSPLPGVQAVIVNERFSKVADGESGELCVGGEQTALGYWRAKERTEERFMRMPWDDALGVWYRTGDIVLRDPGGRLLYRGRNDDQVKVRGFRIELGEVEFALRRVSGTESAAVITVSRVETIELVAFVAGRMHTTAALLAALAEILPPYMVPAQIRFVDELPVNGSGKIDRPALRRWVEEHGQA